jgi:hypothetical protein
MFLVFEFDQALVLFVLFDQNLLFPTFLSGGLLGIKVLDFLIELLVLLDKFFVLLFQLLCLTLCYSSLLINLRKIKHCIHFVDFLFAYEFEGEEIEGRSHVSELKIDDGVFVGTVAQMILNVNCELFLDVLQVDFFPAGKFLFALQTKHHTDLERGIFVTHMKLVTGVDL